MTIFGSFKGFKNQPTRLVWGDVKNEMGESICDFDTKKNWATDIVKLKFGNRYKIDFNGDEIAHVQKINKIAKCEIIRRFKDEFHFIGGKYQGKKDSDLNKCDLNKYCIWLAQNTYNEITIKNVLLILKKLHDE
jgi:hypothetical protein